MKSIQVHLSKLFKFLDLVLLVPALDHAPVEVGGKEYTTEVMLNSYKG